MKFDLVVTKVEYFYYVTSHGGFLVRFVPRGSTLRFQVTGDDQRFFWV